MENSWSDRKAKEFVARYRKDDISEDIALRVFTTQLLGREPSLVLHGGGNTSVKTVQQDLLGEEVEVLCVKGSGWDMGWIEPAGLPAVRLVPLQKLRALDQLNDFDMVNAQRGNLLDSNSPNPSVETLLHAFLPHKFIDHTHSTAVLSLTDQEDGEAICRRVFGERMAIVPYIMPGFELAKKAAEIYEENAAVDGLILLKDGIFTFADTAKTAYDRMIEFVSLAEAEITRYCDNSFVPVDLPPNLLSATEIAPVIRGICAIRDDNQGAHKSWILDHRSDDRIINFVNGREVGRYSQQGVVTPDHNIRIKNRPLILPVPTVLAEFKADAGKALEQYVADYHDYFARNNPRYEGRKVELDPLPRVALVPGIGLFGIGRNVKEAAINADLAENNIETITDAERLGKFNALPEEDLFDVEYWALEQAKLGKAAEPALMRQVAVVTGGAGAIGRATAKAMAAAGAEIALLDVDQEALVEAAAEIGDNALGITCDVTDRSSINTAFEKVIETFGGVDILVSNAGAAWQGKIGEVDDEVLRQSFELNFFAHQSIAQMAVAIMRQQNTGGCLLFNTSKQAINPGADFGPYGLPKAATLFLVRQYALDHGHEGIRANAVNADRIRSGLLTDEMIADRSKARGVDEQEYMSGNLLAREVSAEDVAQAFLNHALALKTTGDVTTVDGGNIAATLR